MMRTDGVAAGWPTVTTPATVRSEATIGPTRFPRRAVDRDRWPAVARAVGRPDSAHGDSSALAGQPRGRLVT